MDATISCKSRIMAVSVSNACHRIQLASPDSHMLLPMEKGNLFYTFPGSSSLTCSEQSDETYESDYNMPNTGCKIESSENFADYYAPESVDESGVGASNDLFQLAQLRKLHLQLRHGSFFKMMK